MLVYSFCVYGISRNNVAYMSLDFKNVYLLLISFLKSSNLLSLIVSWQIKTFQVLQLAILIV